MTSPVQRGYRKPGTTLAFEGYVILDTNLREVIQPKVGREFQTLRNLTEAIRFRERLIGKHGGNGNFTICRLLRYPESVWAGGGAWRKEAKARSSRGVSTWGAPQRVSDLAKKLKYSGRPGTKET